MAGRARWVDPYATMGFHAPYAMDAPQAVEMGKTMFRDALGSVTQSPPKLMDIAQLAAASLPGKD